MMRLGDYELIERIGEGGMGEVWRAANAHTHVAYAVKLLPVAATSDPGFVKRFFDEGRLMAELEHPGIVRVHHVGHDQPSGRYYLVMDLVRDVKGRSHSLHDALAAAPESRLPEARVRELALQIAEALAFAHGKGVVHRDIKPANVMIDAAGHARLTDFGLAKALGGEFLRTQIHKSISASMTGRSLNSMRTARPASGVTKSLGDEETDGHGSTSESLIGTYDYMSPEARGELPGVEVGARSDVYSFGVMLYRMLTGRRPTGMARPPSELVKGASKTWDGLIARCLEHDPQARFADGRELLAALRTGKASRKGANAPTGKGAMVLAVAVVLAAVAWAGWEHGWKPRQAETLQREEDARLDAGKRSKIASLLAQIEEHRSAKAYDKALAAVREVLTADPQNDRAIRLNNEIKESIGIVGTVPLMNRARMGLGSARDVVIGWSGFSGEVARLELEFTNGTSFLELKEYGEASGKFLLVEEGVKELRQQDLHRQGAITASNRMVAARAEAASAGAMQKSSALWREGGRTADDAEAGYRAGNFGAASNRWEAAGQVFIAARSFASEVDALEEAKKKYERALGAEHRPLAPTGPSSVIRLLESHGGAKWKAVCEAAAAAAAATNEPNAGIGLYLDACTNLTAAIEEATRREQAAEIEARLVVARRARGATGDEPRALAEAVLSIDPMNAEAVALADAADAEAAKGKAQAAGADRNGGPAWVEGGRRSTAAVKAFETSDFAGASRDWKSAAACFRDSEAFAGEMKTYEATKEEYESALKAEHTPVEPGGPGAVTAVLEAHGGALWDDVRKHALIGAASTNDPVAGTEAYRKALEALPAAVQGAVVGERRAAAAARVAEAKTAKTRGDWDTVKMAAGAALKLEDGHTEASALKNEAEREMQMAEMQRRRDAEEKRFSEAAGSVRATLARARREGRRALGSEVPQIMGDIDSATRTLDGIEVALLCAASSQEIDNLKADLAESRNAIREAPIHPPPAPAIDNEQRLRAEGARQSAEDARREALGSRADGTKSRGHRKWEEAESFYKDGQGHFSAGRMADAERAWKEADTRFREAKRKANDVDPPPLP